MQESEDEDVPAVRRKTETDTARKECKARSVLNKFKEMESRVLNGEDEG